MYLNILLNHNSLNYSHLQYSLIIHINIIQYNFLNIVRSYLDYSKKIYLNYNYLYCLFLLLLFLIKYLFFSSGVNNGVILVSLFENKGSSRVVFGIWFKNIL